MRRVLTVRIGLARLLAGSGLAALPADAKIVVNTIGATAALRGNGHVARGTVLVQRDARQTVVVTLTLTQGGVRGTGWGPASAPGS